MAETLKAFVISPIGDAGQPMRAHADWVLNEIIRPACRRASADTAPIVVERSDHSSLPGAIMSQVITSIVEDQIVFAVLAGDRPNVYYELALAIAAGRPVIILKHEGENTHFDVKDFRAVTYAYKEQGTNEPVGDEKIAEVASFVRSVVNMERGYHPKAFGDLDPLGRGYREYTFYERFRDIDIPTYSRLFHDAKSYIGLQGMTLRHFTMPQFQWNAPDGKGELSFFDLLRGKILFDAVSVNVVMMHPATPAFANMFKFSDRSNYTKSLDNAREEAVASLREWNELSQELAAAAPSRADGRKGELRVTPLRYGMVNYRMTLTDETVVISPYFNVFPYNSYGPAIGCAKGTVFHDRVNREFFDRIVSEERAVAAVQEHGSLTTVSPRETG
jgi:hypothetical protein